MRTGDLILVKYRFDPVSWVIRLATKCNWNHIAWVIDKETILEVTSGGIKLSPIKKYNNEYLFKTKVIRLKKFLKKKLDLIMETEKIWVNYSWYNLPRYKLPLFFTFLGIAFKIKVNRFVCSSYIAYILKQHDVVIADKDIMYITPSDIVNSNQVKYTDCCKNPDITVAIDNINNKERTYCFNCNGRLKCQKNL